MASVSSIPTEAIEPDIVAAEATEHAPAARKAMIESQLRPSGITDAAVLTAMARTAREDYVGAAQRPIAYMDRSIPLGEGRALSAPLAHALLLQTARPESADKALLIGGSTGYLAALLAPMVASLDVVEGAALSGTGAKAGNWHEGALDAGWKKGAPYDLIIVDGAIEQLPKAIASQLADNGRIVTGMVTRGVTRLAIGRKAGNGVVLQPLGETGMPVLTDFAIPKSWSF